VAVGIEPANFRALVKCRIEGRELPARSSPKGPLPALVGARLARQAGLTVEAQARPVVALISGVKAELEILGVVSSGDAEEDQLFLPLGAVEELARLPGRRSAVLLRIPGRPEEVSRILSTISAQAAEHGMEAKVMRRIAQSGATALRKVRGLLAILSAVLVTAALLSAGTVLMEQAIERRAEVGLMKALGAQSRDIARLVILETGVLGLVGGVLGSVVGILVADLLERAVFRRALAIPWGVPPVAVALGLCLALVAVMLPLKASLSVVPAVALKEAS
jgi:putative ABC transport system permease protein